MTLIFSTFLIDGLQLSANLQISINMISQFEWKTVDASHSTPKPSARWGHSCCVVDDNFYLFGGFANSTYMNDLWRYSLADLKWKQLTTNGDKPERRSNATLNYDKSNNQLLLFGGGGSNKQRFNSISILDLQTLNWVQLQPFQNQASPWERTYHVSEFLSPYLVVFGGESADDLGDLWVYNINSLSWVQIKFNPQSLRPTARRFHSSCLVGNIFYLFGGCFNKYICLNDLYSLDLTPLKEDNQINELAWRQIPLSGRIDPRWGHSLHHYNGELYIFGGRSNQDLNDLIAINPENGQSRYLKGEKSPHSRRRHSGGFIGSSLVLFGGFDGTYFDDFFYINLYELIRSSTTQEIQKISNQHFNHTITCLDNTQIQINTSIIGRYFASQSKMIGFMQAINGCYIFQEIKQIMQTFEDGFGPLPLQVCHNLLLDYHPSEDKTTHQQSIFQLINQNPSPFIKRRSSDNTVELDLHLMQKYLTVLDQHWQNDSQIIFNQTKCRVNRDRLARHSEYFSYLLSNQYLEKDQIFVEVVRLESFNFRLLIAYLFTGILVVPIHSSIHVFISLLELAEYFSLPSLVNICEKQLCSRISSLNYKQLLKLSTTFNLSRLTEHCSYKYLNELIKYKNQNILIGKEELHPKTMELYKSIQFDLLHIFKNNCSNKNPVLNAQNEKQNKPMNEISLKNNSK